MKIMKTYLLWYNSATEGVKLDITEDPFAIDKSASILNNVEVRNINKKTEINKSKSIKWDNPKLK